MIFNKTHCRRRRHLTVLRIIEYPPAMLIRIREFNVEWSDERTGLIRGLIDT